MDRAITILGWVAAVGAGVSLATAVVALVAGMPVCAAILATAGIVNGWLALDD